MCCDQAGWLYVATDLGVQVCDQAGRVNAILPLPAGRVTASASAGQNFDTLYATCADTTYRRRLNTTGAESLGAAHLPPAPQLEPRIQAPSPDERRTHQILGPENVLIEREDLIPYSFDATAVLRQMPRVVVFPAHRRRGLRRCSSSRGRHKVPVVARGSGTGLSGGSVPTPARSSSASSRWTGSSSSTRAIFTMRARPGS
jgi:hypothetical protein